MITQHFAFICAFGLLIIVWSPPTFPLGQGASSTTNKSKCKNGLEWSRNGRTWGCYPKPLEQKLIDVNISDCNTPGFAEKFQAYSLIKNGSIGGVNLAASLAFLSGKKSPHYQKLEEFAEKSQNGRQLKAFVDVMQTEMDEAVKKMSEFRKLTQELRAEFEKKYGHEPNWRSRYAGSYNERLDALAKEKGIPLNFDFGAKHKANILAEFNEKTEKYIKSLSIPEAHKNYFTNLKFMGQGLLSEMLFSERRRAVNNTAIHLDPEKRNPQDLEEIRAEKKRVRRNFNWYLETIDETAKAIQPEKGTSLPEDNSAGSNKTTESGKGANFRAGAVSVLGTAAVAQASRENAKAATRACQKRFGLSDGDVDTFAEQIDTRSIPSLLDPNSINCDSLNLFPSAGIELKDEFEVLSPGKCRALQNQMNNIQAEMEPKYSLGFEKCESSPVKIDGKQIGEFVQVDTDHFYFQIPAGQNQLGANFYIHSVGRMDFDPERIDCFRLINGVPQNVSSCSGTITGALTGRSGFGYSHSNGREKLFNSKQICQSINSDFVKKPFCTFADNVAQIRQAFSGYATKCFKPGEGKEKGTEGSKAQSTR